ncbi:type VII secretion integral membrane protein EccD [Amycolatopsis sacchari]|uniref:type VII secretion integral membrane protein EccD n=1 Tax=Amycolatopsis sacchari TaxID=115433 RepID=UPI000B8143DF|nr:type VII secretion integral membrane protein EccD [Amycolatopsis sacchari]
MSVSKELPTTGERPQHRTTASGRLRFVLGGRAIDVALPVEVPLAELLPAVLPQFGAEWVEQGADHEGWVVQRLGEAPLDEDRTPAELGLLDGETVYLRPRADQLAPIDYDDLVDGVGEQVREHPGAWTPARTRVMLRIGAAVLLLLGIPLLAGAGADALTASLGGFVTFALLAGSALVARGAAEPVVATILAGVAACYGALSGVLLVFMMDPVATGMMALTCGAAGALLALVLGLLAVADSAALFAAGITTTAALVVPGLVGSVSPASPQQAAAIGLVVTLLAGIFVPATAFRLSGLTLPMLPTSAAELTEDIDPVPYQVVIDRGAATVGYSRALHVGLGLAQTLLLPMLVVDGDGWLMALSLVIAFLLFLRSRHPDGIVQRWAVLVPAGVTVVANLLRLAVGQDLLERLLALWFSAVVVGVLLLVLGNYLPGRRLRPYWGRAVDILESVTAVAVLPVLLQVLHVYAFVRGLSG